MWHLPQPLTPNSALTALLGDQSLLATLLTKRGITTPEAARGFLDPDQYTPAPPAALPDLDFAADRLYRAITRGESIAVWGDFDADGQTSTTLLVSLLRDLRANVTYYIPHRLTESHGIKIESLDRLIDQHVNVLLTCDTGISEQAAIDHAKARGVTVLVTDHHDLPDELPQADALINPQRLPPDHALRNLPGVGVAFKLAQQVLHLAGEDQRADEYLDLVALGIVADVAEQRADTRYLLQRGLDRLRRTTRLGLQTIMELAQINTANVSAETIGFALGPRLNALGRLGDANLAVELLTTTNLTRARILASQLEGLNNQRKLLMDQITSAAQEIIAKEPSMLDYAALVLSQPHWHSGVIGPVANRLAEQYQKPTVLLVTNDDGTARGSARSVAGVDITRALKMCGPHLNNVGGHPGAAGLSLPVDNIPVFRAALSKAVDTIRDPAVDTGLVVDAVLPFDLVTLDLAREIERLAPFGEGNPPVTLVTRMATIERERAFGRKREHREVTVADATGAHNLIWWRGAEADLPEGPIDVAYTIKSTNYRGEAALTIEWVDFQSAPVEALEVAPAIGVSVIDWRERATTELSPAPDWLIWADGAQSVPWPSVRRYDLREANTLVMWSAPCGWREIEYAMQRVKPKTIYLCNAAGPDDKLEPFLKRLTGLLKHDLNQRSGQVDVLRLAAALNQRLITARKGVEWLEAAGQIAIIDWGEDQLTIAARNDRAETDNREGEEAQLLLAELRALLAETAAWRGRYRYLKIGDVHERAVRHRRE